MKDPVLIGAEDVLNGAHRIQQAAQTLLDVAGRMEDAFQQRRQWEEEYLRRIEAIVERELTFYAEKAE